LWRRGGVQPTARILYLKSPFRDVLKPKLFPSKGLPVSKDRRAKARKSVKDA
jgi:hypothetical protein